MDLHSWSLGLALIVLTIAIHTTAVVFMSLILESRVRARAGTYVRGPLRAIPAVTGQIGAVALILTALHGLEGVIWALAYFWLGGFDSFGDASVFSLGTMTTGEIPGMSLPARLRMFGALEAVNGALLFGISTAFLFAVIQVHWKSLSRRRDRLEDMEAGE